MQTETIDHRRRRFLAPLRTIAATQIRHHPPCERPGCDGARWERLFRPVQVGVLNMRYVEAGLRMVRPSSCCMAGHMTSTALSRSSRCSPRRDTG